ncbi:hypothetical protein [Nocardioides dongkuii]|uniref:hypothetical protein n=1 Tax=Nocardioides dongkuii TaxID=2760089 RepID=UPI0015FDFDB6|nr:hypothetical protein [Nocardioides dongkuii]
MKTTRTALVLAGLALAGYPALRPYGPETGLEGAADLGSTAWLVSHVLGMLGFVLVALALRSASVAGVAWRGLPLRSVESRAWVAVALLLPYYGAEAYGLNELGRHATATGDATVLDVADAFRYAPLEVATFAAGLLVLAVVGVHLARGRWAVGGVARWGGLLAGAGLATYLPQFFATPELRVAHGAVLGLGLLLTAAGLREDREPAAAEQAAQSPLTLTI